MHKNVLITGCSSGLGLSMVKVLLANQWRVLATARDLSTSTELKNLAHPMLIKLKLDVTNENERQEIRDYIDRYLEGRLDCLINNAGFGLFGALEELSEAQIRYQIDVNVLGVILLIKKCLPALREKKGRIINISSVLGYLGVPLQSLYSTSKFALEGLSEALYYELAPFGVQVCLIEPGLYQTKFSANAKFPLTENKLSEYEQQNDSLLNFRSKISKMKGSSLDDFANQILKLLNLDKMPLRKRMGRDANLIYYIRRFLPAFMFNKLMGLMFKKMF